MKDDDICWRKFWAIWRTNGGGAAQKKHNTKLMAIQEAERLVKQTGEEYSVLEVIGVCEHSHPPVKYTEL